MTGVLDASALLAYLHQEDGWEKVQAMMGERCIGAVNWCEVAQKTARKGLDVARVRSLLKEIGLAIVPFTPEQAESAAVLWEHTKGQGLSLADRACLALALERKVPVFTADRAWVELGLDLDIQIIR